MCYEGISDRKMFGETETETETENVWAPAQPVVKCLGVTGNVWRDGKCLGDSPTRQDSQPVDSPTRR